MGKQEGVTWEKQFQKGKPKPTGGKLKIAEHGVRTVQDKKM